MSTESDEQFDVFTEGDALEPAWEQENIYLAAKVAWDHQQKTIDILGRMVNVLSDRIREILDDNTT